MKKKEKLNMYDENRDVFFALAPKYVEVVKSIQFKKGRKMTMLLSTNDFIFISHNKMLLS